MTVMFIISTITVISLNSYKYIKVDAAAKKVANDLEFTRNLALSMAKWYGVSFEVSPANTYLVYQTNGIDDLPIEDPSRNGKNFIVNLYDYFGGATISSVNISGGHKVEFSPLGVPYADKNDPSGIALTSSVTVEFSGLTKTIYIYPSTGRITTQ
jgi:hypothetical protein